MEPAQERKTECAAGSSRPTYLINPLEDNRWEQFLQSHPQSSIFHTSAWLEALRRTYGYRSWVITSNASTDPLTNAVVFCEVDSWLTGSRLVSLPFADHCQPLVSSTVELSDLARSLSVRCQGSNRYIELRPLNFGATGIESQTEFGRSASYLLHTLDLRPSLETLFQGLHSSCIQRKISRAEREGLFYEAGNSDAAIERFYSLLTLTRQRHGLPPQPLAWFRNLRDCMGRDFTIHLASSQGKPIAGILTLTHKRTLVYKYGVSDARFHKLGAMPFLFWHVIQEGKKLSLVELDLGRSDTDQQGLISFKNHLGATSSPLNYYRYPDQNIQRGAMRSSRFISQLYSHLPRPLLRTAGRILYRHFG